MMDGSNHHHVDPTVEFHILKQPYVGQVIRTPRSPAAGGTRDTNPGA